MQRPKVQANGLLHILNWEQYSQTFPFQKFLKCEKLFDWDPDHPWSVFSSSINLIYNCYFRKESASCFMLHEHIGLKHTAVKENRKRNNGRSFIALLSLSSFFSYSIHVYPCLLLVHVAQLTQTHHYVINIKVIKIGNP